MLMTVNKAECTRNILRLANYVIKPCTKLQMDNIVFPKWNKAGLLGMIFRQNIRTKEQPEGCFYDEATYQVVMRVIKGHVLMTGGRPDAYTWKQSKVDSSKNIRLIGTNCAEAVLNLSEIIQTIPDPTEKRLFADMFCRLKDDLLLITSPVEQRSCIEITEELYQSGLTYCVDQWMETDADGKAAVTNLDVGDFLIVSEHKDSVYCIRHDEFMATHCLT
ncbi:MAG: hypothetical protein HFJ28_07455 [Clostridia bacterium]|nr:hypothetical protein [Clostridia bacterium]